MKIDMQEIINAKIVDLEESGTIRKTIEEGIEKTVLGAITSALTDYRLKNDLEKLVSKQVSTVVEGIGFTAYNSFIAEKVKQITEGVCNKDIADKIQKTFDQILVLKRDNIKLSEIFDQYRDWICREVDDCEKYNLERFHIKFEEDDDYGWFNVELKPTSRYGRSDEVIRFVLHRNHKDKNIGWISGTYIDGINIKESIKFGLMSDIELLLINLTYNETPIEIDIDHEDDIDNSFDVDY